MLVLPDYCNILKFKKSAMYMMYLYCTCQPPVSDIIHVVLDIIIALDSEYSL